MKRFLPSFVIAALVLALTALPLGVRAQVVTQLPVQVTSGVTKDLGNGPMEILVVQGSTLLTTSQSSGTSGNATSSSTALTVTATPATPPCVGCIIAGTGITSGTTVTATSGTSITLSAAMTVATSTALTWGAACPASPPTSPGVFIQASVGANGWPLYTQARVCANTPNGPGASLLPFAIGAH